MLTPFYVLKAHSINKAEKKKNSPKMIKVYKYF